MNIHLLMLAFIFSSALSNRVLRYIRTLNEHVRSLCNYMEFTSQDEFMQSGWSMLETRHDALTSAWKKVCEYYHKIIAEDVNTQAAEELRTEQDHRVQRYFNAEAQFRSRLDELRPHHKQSANADSDNLSAPDGDSISNNKPTASSSSLKPTYSDMKSKSANKYCFHCYDETHWFSECEIIRKIDINVRTKLIHLHRLCLNCLKPGHKSIKCTFPPCNKCQKPHNALICKK